MKKGIFIVLLFLVSTIHVFGQYEGDKLAERYERKLKSSKKIKNVGIGLAIGGIAGTIGGIAMMSAGIDQMNNSYNGDDGALLFEGGFILTALGIGSTVTGAILSISGANKTRYYKKKLENLSFQFNYLPQRKVIGLSYRF